MRELAKHNSSTLFIDSGLQAPILGETTHLSGIHENDAKNSTSLLTSIQVSSRDELCINEYYKRSLNEQRGGLVERFKD